MKKLIFGIGVLSSLVLVGCKGKEVNNLTCDPQPETTKLSTQSTKNNFVYLSTTENYRYTEYELDLSETEDEEYFFSSYVNIVLYSDTHSEQDITRIFNQIEEIYTKYHKQSNRWVGYEGLTNIYSINENPTATHQLEPELYGLLKKSLEFNEETNGYFNIALSPVIDIWDSYRERCNYYGDCKIPSKELIESKRDLTDISKVILDDKNMTITMAEGMMLDLGAIAKGYATEVVKQILDSEFDYFRLDAGSSTIYFKGDDPRKDKYIPYQLWLTDPSTCGVFGICQGYYEKILIENIAIGTSADYSNNYKIKDGNNELLCHHIISPVTLRPERYMRAITVLSDSAAEADAFSTALFTMPVDEALALVNSKENMYIVLYDINGYRQKSNGFDQKFPSIPK